MSKQSFYFIRIPGYDSFALIEVLGELPTVIPTEVLQLMPGNSDGKSNRLVVLRQDERYLNEQVRNNRSDCFSWFTGLEEKPWTQKDNLTYRRVGSYMMM